MSLPRLLGLAALAALGIAVIPFLIPTGPTAGLDASTYLEGGRFAVAGGVIFLGGLLTSLTPCVYPLIPITVGVFGARQATSRGKAVVLTSAYVVGMGVVFATLGVVAAMAGKAFGAGLGNQWVVIGLAIFLLVLSSSMFGAFELAIPSGVATRLNNVGGGGLIGAFLMGAVSGFLAAPCTGPVLSGVLAYVAKTQDPVIGGSLLFIYALGIGLPFFLIGVFLVRLPKGGEWMEWVKSVFGIALVALAVAYLRDAFGPMRELFDGIAGRIGLWGGVAIASVLALIGVGAGAIHRSFKDDAGDAMLKAAGVLALVVALTLRISVGHLAPATAAGADKLEWAMTFHADQSGSDEPFEQALAQAKKSCKPVMIDFFAEWCAACKELDKLTYTSQPVVKESEKFINIKVDGTNDHVVLDKLYQRFGVQGLPTVAFLDARGSVLTDPRVTGFLPPDQFLTEIKKIRQDSECSPVH